MELDLVKAVSPEGAPDTTALRQVFGRFPSGVVVAAAVRDGQPVGLAASSFTSVSLQPALVAVYLAHTSTTWPLLKDLPRIGISVLSADQGQLCRQLSGREDRFKDVSWTKTPGGAVLIGEASAWLNCSIEHTAAFGDHDLVVLRVHELQARDVDPLVFHASGFHRIRTHNDI